QLTGPWSPAQVLFDGENDGGYCHYMHRACDPSVGNSVSAGFCCDLDFQPTVYCKFGPAAPNVRPYAAFLLDPSTRFDRTTQTAPIYFLMSVLNPYSPMVMKANLVFRPAVGQ